MLRKFIRYVSLSTLGFTAISCYILADTFFVSKGMGVGGLTALNLAIPVYSFIHGAGLMLGVGAYAVISNISLVAVALFSGIEQGAQPLFTVAHGEGNKSEMRKLITYTVLTVLIFSAIIYLILYLSTENIVKLFNGENNIEMSKIAVKGIRLYYPATVCTGINIVCATYFSATEKTFRAQVISLLRGVVLIVPLAFLCSFLWQTEGVWLSYPITEIIVFFVALILFFIPKIRRPKEKLQINRKFGK